ncbi:MAG: TetR/AcrR family transcriptional regulator [Sulfobacillus benefaciens]|uniref:TetR/AcrR family transcriptional regulator n=1 Tax=Sulfobacillus benefaciens TaxID=453960 RepID=A0A2T2XLB3_9FIRM|nr:MAG: TetR/AcrR family transcriptional regulator [Sulfobacillus benefaciens]
MARASKKSEIVEAAAYLFSTKGYHATTVRDIAERAGILSGSLYAHIDNKEALLREIVKQAANQFMSAVQPIVDSDLPITVKFTEAVRAHVGVVTNSLDGARIYLDEKATFSDEGRQEFLTLRRAYENLWTRLIEQGIKQSVFWIEDPHLARLLVLSALNGIHRWYRPQGRLTPEVIASRYSSWLLRLLQPEMPR